MSMFLFLTGAEYWTASANPQARWLAVGSAALVAAVWIAALLVRRGRMAQEPVLLLGGGPLGPKVCEEIRARRDQRFRVIGVVAERPVEGPPSAAPRWMGTPGDLRGIVERTKPQRIVLTMGDRRGRIPEAVLLELRFRGVIVEDGAEFFERVSGKLAIEALRPSALILSGGFRNVQLTDRGGVWRALGRAVEAVVAATALLLLAPLFAVIAVGTKLDSRGPVFFVQARVGRGGRPFGLVKFRTMREATGACSEWVCDNEERVTRLG